MELPYSYLTFREPVLVPTDVRQKTTTVMERRGHTFSPWSSMFYVGISKNHNMNNFRVSYGRFMEHVSITLKEFYFGCFIMHMV